MHTALYDHHCQAGAKIVNFAGWQMPVHYHGVISEHQAVRESVGLFDVSHMGRILVEGPDAEKLLDHLSTNNVRGKPCLSTIYTAWCHENGGTVDDVLIFKTDKPQRFFVVCNAGNREKDLQHLTKYADGLDVTIRDYFSGYGILALQGPQATVLLSELFFEASEIKPMGFKFWNSDDEEIIVSRTGYTGAGGFELFAANDKIIHLWENLLEKGKKYGIQPVGLGARDTLRLEMGFALYGHELTDEITPLESVSAWTVKLDKSNFVGKKALEIQNKNPSKRFAYGVKFLDYGIPRQGYPVIKNNQDIGAVTSGSFSPSLEKGIALILVNTPLMMEEMVEIKIRQSLCLARVVQIPFMRKNA